MNKAGIYHQCAAPWCYAYDANTLHIRIRTAANDIDRVELVSADPFEWNRDGDDEYWNSEIRAMSKAGSNGVHDFWEICIQLPYNRLKYWFILHDGKKTCEFGEKGLVDHVDRRNIWNTFIFPYLHESEVFRAPEWAAKTVWYQIFPERFNNGNAALNPGATRPWHYGPVTNQEFYGGDLPGITAKLDHIASLGINGIYLTPIFASPSVHKYDTTDYMKIDPAFGTGDDLRTLVAECHKRGIRIILDAVFNHSGTRFAPWLDVLENGEKSKYRDWFAIDRFPLFPASDEETNARGSFRDSHDAGFHTFAFTTGMPKLNTSNPETREYLMNVAEYYIKEFDIDGWRLDVANEIPHDFWRVFRSRVKAIKSDAYIVGEIWHNSMDWLNGDQYDAVMNYHFGQAICNFLSRSEEIPDARALAGRMTTLEFLYPVPVIRAGFNLLESHDTERLIDRLGGDLAAARQAWLLFALLPGAPCFYYGGEYALTGGSDPDNRRCMPWESAHQTAGQFEFMKEIIALRRDNSELVNKGTRNWIFDRRYPGLFGMRISYEGKSLVVLVNRSDKPLQAKKYARLLSENERTNPVWTDIASSGFAYGLS